MAISQSNRSYVVRAVVQQVVPQTSRLKGAHRVIERPWRFGFVKYIWPVLRIPQSAASYRKVFPICAGVSTGDRCPAM